jgi:hypothetical protein
MTGNAAKQAPIISLSVAIPMFAVATPTDISCKPSLHPSKRTFCHGRSATR